MWRRMVSEWKNWNVCGRRRPWPNLNLHPSACTEELKETMKYISIRSTGFREPGSLVSIVSGYGLDNWAIEVRSPAEARDFSSNLCVQTGSGAHPASCTMGTGGPSPGIKRGRGVTLITHPYLVPRLWMSRCYTSYPPLRLHTCVVGLLYLQPVSGPRFQTGIFRVQSRDANHSTCMIDWIDQFDIWVSLPPATNTKFNRKPFRSFGLRNTRESRTGMTSQEAARQEWRKNLKWYLKKKTFIEHGDF
jgi:hypothetical protein